MENQDIEKSQEIAQGIANINNIDNIDNNEINYEDSSIPKSKKERFKEIFFYIINFDIFFSTITVFVILAILPLTVTAPIFFPFKSALEDFEITDIYFSNILPTLDLPKETDIVLVNIGVPTNDGYRVIGNFTLSKLLDEINLNEPNSIGIETILRKDTVNELYNYILANSLNNTKNLVLTSTLTKYNEDEDLFKDIITSDSIFLENATIGFANFLKNKDKRYNTIREFYPKLYLSQHKNKNNKKITLHPFGLELARKLNPDAVERLLNRKNELETISYLGNHDKFDVIDAVDVLEQNIDPNIFRNKIVLLAPFDTSGVSMELKDIYYTPMNERTAGRTFADMYEVFIHANIISMLLTDNYFDSMTNTESYFYAFLLCYINLAIFQFISDKNKKWYEISALMLFAVSSIAIAYLTVHSFYEYKYQMNLTLAIVASATSLFVFEVYYDTVKPLVLKLIEYILSLKLFNFIKSKV